MRPTVTTLALAAALLAAGCDDGTSPPAACGPVEHPELQGGGHLVGDAGPPVPYSSTPGTSGWHRSGTPRTGVPDEPLSEPEIVAALENGQVVAAYDPDALPPDQVALLEELATDRFAGELTVTAFEQEMGAPVVLNAWGTRMPCGVVDPDAVADFVSTHAGEDGH